MKGKTKRQVRQQDYEDHFCVAYDKRLRSSILSEFAIYYRADLFCDVAIYCPASQGDDLSSQHAVQQDVWITPDGPEVGLPTRWSKVRCHSLVLAALSPAMRDILQSHAPESPTCNCNSAGEPSELFSLVLPSVPAREVVFMLNQAYSALSYIGRVSLNISRRCYEAFRLTPDNPMEIDDAKTGPISTTLRGFSGRPKAQAAVRASPNEDLLRKRKLPLDLEPNGSPVKLLKPNSAEGRLIFELKREARKNCSKLRVTLERLPRDHPGLPRVVVDLPRPLKFSPQILPVPVTVAHVFADILDNLKRNRSGIGTVQTISETSFNRSDFAELEPRSAIESGRPAVDHEYSASATPVIPGTAEAGAANAPGVQKLVLKPISREEVLANLAKMTSSHPVVVKPLPVKLNIKETAYKGYSKASPVVMRRDIVPDDHDQVRPPESGRHVTKPIGNCRATSGLPKNVHKNVATRYARLESRFSGHQLSVMSKFLPQSRLEFLPHSAELEYSNDMLESIVSSSGKISVVTIDHDRTQIFICPVCDQAVEDQGVDAYCHHVSTEHQEKPKIECQDCGKQCLLTANFLSHTFQHRLLDFSKSCTVALLGISSRQGKNIACTLACNRDGWDTENSLFNFMKALEIVFGCTTEKLFDVFQPDRKCGSTSGTDAGVARLKDQYIQMGLTAAEQRAKLDEFLSRDSNMFETRGQSRPPLHQTPQIPAFTFQVRLDLELVSAISFDELLDVAIVLENKQTKQLEVMSAARIALQSKLNTSLTIPSNFPALMQPVLARLLNCSSPEEMRAVRSNLFKDYFRDFESIVRDVHAIREILNTVQCPQCHQSFHVGSAKGRFLYETHKEMHLFGDCGCRLIIKVPEKRAEHMRNIHGYSGDQLPESCGCKANFKNVRVKALHMKKIHQMEIDLYNCTYTGCTMAFVTEETRDAHLKAGNHQIHTVCEECGKTFGAIPAWRIHKNKHHKVFSCNICNKSVIGSSNLKYHRVRCASGRWRCHICRSTFGSEDELNGHKAVKHVKQQRQKVVTCNICFREFGRLEYLRNHEKRVHFRPPNERGHHVTGGRQKHKSSKRPIKVVENVPAEDDDGVSTIDVVQVQHQFYL